jgi:hypothetical protein
VSLTWKQVRAQRVSRHFLDRRAPKGELLKVVRDVCGIHAQVQSSAELQLWARLEGVSRAEIRDALWEARKLVRTWCMRGTLHLLTTEDLPLYVSALRQHDRWWKGAWLRMIGMKESELRATLEAIRDSLGARPITRDRLAEKVAAKVGHKARDRMMSGWGEMLKPAAFHGYLCSGPPKGQSVRFVRPDRWLKDWNVPEPEEAWPEIVRRYFSTYGPATREEFARWWGMQPAPAGRVLKATGDQLTEVQIEGQPAWILAKDSSVRKPRQMESVRLLPAFDVYIAATRPRASFVDRRFENLVFRKAGWISPVVAVDGWAAGIWKQERNARRLEITVQPFGSLSTSQRKKIGAEVDRLGHFINARAVVELVGTP